MEKKLEIALENLLWALRSEIPALLEMRIEEAVVVLRECEAARAWLREHVKGVSAEELLARALLKHVGTRW